MLLDVFTDEGHVSWRNSPTWNKVLGSGHGWLEAAAEHSAAQVVPASNWQCCYEWIRPGCSDLEHAHQDLWILPEQVRTSYFSDSLITIVFLRFLLNFSSDWEHISNTQDIVWSHFQTPKRFAKIIPLRVVFLNSLLCVWKCGQTRSFLSKVKVKSFIWTRSIVKSKYMLEGSCIIFANNILN